MSNCCSTVPSEPLFPKKHHCPVNGQEYSKVPTTTVLHHVAKPWSRELPEQAYYFCDDPECSVVYFGHDNSVIQKSELKVPVGVKDRLPDSTICYCFDVTMSDAINVPITKAYVARKTREGVCSCETSNPSGRCCLKEFPTK